MRILCGGAVACLLLALVIGAQTGTATLVVEWDTANGPLCTPAAPVDCIQEIRILRGGASVASVAASALLPVSGSLVRATLPAPPGGVRFGTVQYTAVAVALAADGSELPSDESPSVQIVVRPRPPVLRVQ
jgi:hypothetical protein